MLATVISSPTGVLVPRKTAPPRSPGVRKGRPRARSKKRNHTATTTAPIRPATTPSRSTDRLAAAIAVAILAPRLTRGQGRAPVSPRSRYSAGAAAARSGARRGSMDRRAPPLRLCRQPPSSPARERARLLPGEPHDGLARVCEGRVAPEGGRGRGRRAEVRRVLVVRRGRRRDAERVHPHLVHGALARVPPRGAHAERAGRDLHEVHAEQCSFGRSRSPSVPEIRYRRVFESLPGHRATGSERVRDFRNDDSWDR